LRIGIGAATAVSVLNLSIERSLLPVMVGEGPPSTSC
jgi:hypothetical protein